MSHAHNVEMWRGRLRALQDPAADRVLQAALVHDRELLANIQARIDRMEHEIANRPQLIDEARKNLRKAIKRERLAAHEKSIAQLLKLRDSIDQLEACNDPED